MKEALTTMLTLVLMVIGLALIVGGPGALRFLFAPFVAGLWHALRVIFVVLVMLVLLAAVLSAKKSSPEQAQEATTTVAEGTPENVGHPGAGEEGRDDH